MTEDNVSGEATTERLRASSLSVGGSTDVTALLSSALKERKPLADDGSLYDSIQAAENAASSFVFVPPGTFNESVTIDTAGLTLLGSGNSTIINGGAGEAVLVNASNVSLEQFTARRDEDATSVHTIDTSSSITDTSVTDVTVDASGSNGIVIRGDNSLVSNCNISNTPSRALNIFGESVIIKNNIINDASIGIQADDAIVVANTSFDSSDGTDGAIVISSTANDCLIGSNRVHNSNSDGITNKGSNDCIIFNNRVSNSNNQDIDDNGTGTTTDANVTGAAN